MVDKDRADKARSDKTVMDEQLPPNWRRKEEFVFRAAWRSKRNERRSLAERLALESLSQGKAVPFVAQLELEDKPFKNRHERWHHYFILQTMTFFKSFGEMLAGVKSFLKRDALDAGSWEMMFSDAPAPVRLSKSQRVALIDKFVKGVKEYPFEDKAGKEVFNVFQPYGDHALDLSIEYVELRPSFDTTFGAEDNPVKSLVGKKCTVQGRASAEENGEKDTDEDEAEQPVLELGEGVLMLDGYTVRVGEWQHTFAEDDEVFESVAFEEVNVYSEALKLSIFLEAVDKLDVNKDDENSDDEDFQEENGEDPQSEANHD